MISKVLVPLDGSKLSEAALPFGVNLVKGVKGSIILMHAVIPSEYFSVTAAQYVHQERRSTALYFDALAERLRNGEFGVETRVLTGEASREIVDEAKRSRVDLIVMSSHGRSGIRDWAFGSVAERVLRSTDIPVLVFRGMPAKTPAVRKILIALDGSEEAHEVLRPAADLAAAFGSSIVLVHVGKKYPNVMPMAERFLIQRGCSYEKRLLRGDPAEALLRAIDGEKPDLFAMTTTGETKRDQIYLGRVAEKVLKACPRPMLVVHTGRTS